MKMDRMRAGAWLYALATIATGIVDIVWRQFEASHQPLKSLGHVPGEQALAIIAGLLLVAAGIALLWRRTARIGATVSAIFYIIFALFWVPRFFVIAHVTGFRIGVVVFVIGGALEQVLLAAPVSILFATTATHDSARQNKAKIAARWMLGLPPIFFGLGHLVSLQGYKPFVPHWVPFGLFWIAFTGIAFLLAGSAIVTGIQAVLAARMLALMLLLFEFMVEIPPIFSHPHSQGAWGGALYNLTAIGVCWMFAEFVSNRSANQNEIDDAAYLTAVR